MRAGIESNSPAGVQATTARFPGPGAARRDFAAEFADFSSAATAGSLPAVAAAAAKANLLDTLACAIAGSNAAGIGELVGLAVGWGGAEQARIWCSGVHVPAHHAAWVNGAMAHARDFDDTHDAAILHAGVSVVPAALAAAELNPDATGADLLAAIACGLELVCRLGCATTIGIIDSGFIYTSLFGYFGATAAAARVLGLDAADTVNALGIAYSQAAGTHQVTRDAALTKRMQPGFAAKAALLSAQMTRAGIRGAQETFEGGDGLFRTYLSGRYGPDRLRDELGRRFDMADLSYKPYPCCRFNHTAIDAALAVRARPGFDPSRVTRIEAGVNHQAYEAVCTPPAMRKAPRTIVGAQFSIPYTVACALLDGAVGLGHFTDAALGRADVLTLAARTECRVDEDIQSGWARSISPTELKVWLGDELFRARIDLPGGHPERPMTGADTRAKLEGCLRFSELAWPEGRADEIAAAVASLETLPRAADLVDLLAPNDRHSRGCAEVLASPRGRAAAEPPGGA